MSESNFQDNGNGLFVPRGTKSAKKGGGLIADMQATVSKKNNFFWLIWGLLAVTTAYYGWENLASLFLAFVNVFPFSPENALIVSQAAGAVMAVVFLDWGYMRWDHVKLNATETAAQYQIANMGGLVAFWGSMFFTVAQIVLAFESSIPLRVVSFLENAGVVVFVVSVSVTAVCKWAFERNSEETLRQANKALILGKSTTEKLGIERDAHENALIGARDDVLANLEPITQRLADGMRGQITAGLMSEVDGFQADSSDTDRYKTLIGSTPLPTEGNGQPVRILNGQNGHH